MLKYTDRWAFVAQLVNTMRDNGGWAGETHIQKALFFLQKMLHVPTEYEFVLYKHGPYSFDLHDDLGRMRAHLILDIEPHPPYGASFGLGHTGGKIAQKSNEAIYKYASQLDFIVKKLGNKDVRSLERFATALFVRYGNPALDNAVLSRAIVGIKPHISEADAFEAVEAVAQIEKDASRENLIL